MIYKTTSKNFLDLFLTILVKSPKEKILRKEFEWFYAKIISEFGRFLLIEKDEIRILKREEFNKKVQNIIKHSRNPKIKGMSVEEVIELMFKRGQKYRLLQEIDLNKANEFKQDDILFFYKNVITAYKP